jgi:hypothetical protein
MKRILLIMVLTVTFLLTACGAAATPAPSYLSASDGGAPMQESYAAAPAPMVDMSRSVANGGGVQSIPQERLVIKNVDLSIVVKDPAAQMTVITKLAEAMGGFVVSSNLSQSYTPNGVTVPTANVVIRVPAEKMDEALTAIKKDAVDVQAENVSGQDVTSQYVDLQSQLKNLEAAEAQLTQIMSKAEKTEDVLNVYNQLVSIRGQIEGIKGQMKYFEESASLSAISVRLVAEESVQPLDVGGWQIKGWASGAVQNLVNFLRGFTKFLIYFVINFLPIVLVIGFVFGLPIWLIGRAMRAANRRRKAKQAPPTEN